VKLQKSFETEGPRLFLVATPIGNLEEMSPRAVTVLRQADVIACEDTRTSGVLFKSFGIEGRLIAYQKYNEGPAAKGILQLLAEGKTVALVSDAGYPLLNDPGQTLVSAVTAAGYPVIPVSGPNAALDALVASGLKAQPFLFIGFLSSKDGERRQQLAQVREVPVTLVFYEAPHRIEKMLGDALEILGDRQCCLGRELTKVHEEFIRGTISEVLAEVKGRRGEMVVVVEGFAKEKKSWDREELLALVRQKEAEGLTRSEAVKAVALKAEVSRRELYNLVMRAEKEED
jgi:16S rRNA (cytidine1402-2'-O)-methyltransferase